MRRLASCPPASVRSPKRVVEPNKLDIARENIFNRLSFEGRRRNTAECPRQRHITASLPPRSNLSQDYPPQRGRVVRRGGRAVMVWPPGQPRVQVARGRVRSLLANSCAAPSRCIARHEASRSTGLSVTQSSRLPPRTGAVSRASGLEEIDGRSARGGNARTGRLSPGRVGRAIRWSSGLSEPRWAPTTAAASSRWPPRLS